MPSTPGVGGYKLPANIQTFGGNSDQIIQQGTTASKSGGTGQQQQSGDAGTVNSEGRTPQQQAMHEQLGTSFLNDAFSRIQQLKNQPNEMDDEVTKGKKSRANQMAPFFQLGGGPSSGAAPASDANTISASKLTAANGGTKA